MHSVVETPDFISDARNADLTNEERQVIATYIGYNPDAGDVISGTGGARKVRFGGRGKGKSGGYRVITFYSGRDIPVFLLNVFSKGDKVNLTKAERNELRTELAGLVDDYRKGIANHVESRKPHSA